MVKSALISTPFLTRFVTATLHPPSLSRNLQLNRIRKATSIYLVALHALSHTYTFSPSFTKHPTVQHISYRTFVRNYPPSTKCSLGKSPYQQPCRLEVHRKGQTGLGCHRHGEWSSCSWQEWFDSMLRYPDERQSWSRQGRTPKSTTVSNGTIDLAHWSKHTLYHLVPYLATTFSWFPIQLRYHLQSVAE